MFLDQHDSSHGDMLSPAPVCPVYRSAPCWLISNMQTEIQREKMLDNNTNKNDTNYCLLSK